MSANGYQIPPHCLEAEVSVLGSILLDNQAFDSVADLITEDDFYREGHRQLYRAMQDMYGRGIGLDPITLFEALKEQGTVEQAGGPEYITRLAESVPTATNAGQYAKIVREKALLRRYIAVQTDLLEEARTGYVGDVDEFLTKAETSVFQLQDTRARRDLVPARELLKGAFQHLEERMRAGNELSGVSSGFPDVDRMTAGMQPTDLLVLAARPAMGKTALALNIAVQAAMSEQATAVFSLEMSAEQLILRALSSLAQVPADRMKRGNLTEQDFSALFHGADKLSKSELYIDDTPALRIGELRSKCRKLKAKSGLGLVVVDYLQLMRGSGSKESREQEVSEISRSLKALAKELYIPVLALSQLNRDLEKRKNRRPQLADLRESGAIEQDADVVMFIYRDEVYSPNSKDKGVAELIFGKQRNGSVGTVRLSFTPEYTRFGSLEQHHTGGGW